MYVDTVNCLEELGKKYRIGIIANQELGTAKRLEQYGILKYIDLVVASAEESVAKPDLRIFKIALERSGCKPRNAIMIGDRMDRYCSCKRSGHGNNLDETERLRIRNFKEEDAGKCFESWGRDINLGRYIHPYPMSSVSQMYELVSFLEKNEKA